MFLNLRGYRWIWSKAHCMKFSSNKNTIKNYPQTAFQEDCTKCCPTRARLSGGDLALGVIAMRKLKTIASKATRRYVYVGSFKQLTSDWALWPDTSPPNSCATKHLHPHPPPPSSGRLGSLLLRKLWQLASCFLLHQTPEDKNQGPPVFNRHESVWKGNAVGSPCPLS